MKLSSRRLARPSLSGMLATRQGSLALALVCALLAALVLVYALGRYKSGVQKVTPQATVLVATGQIAKGTTGEQIAARHLYKSMPVAQSQLPVGAIANAGQLAGETAQANILPGQQLTTSEFAALSGVDETLGSNQRAVEITIAESPGASDITAAGDYVDVYAVAGNTSGSGSVSGDGAQLIASDVKVIKPATAVPVTVGSKAVAGSSLVLALDDRVVPGVIAHSGGLYLSLRPVSTGHTAQSASGGDQ